MRVLYAGVIGGGPPHPKNTRRTTHPKICNHNRAGAKVEEGGGTLSASQAGGHSVPLRRHQGPGAKINENQRKINENQRQQA